MTTLVRLNDWPERLADFLETRRESPFAWGTNDCCLFAADAVLAITGHDFAKAYRGYKSAKQAAALIKKVGNLRAFASELIEKHPGFSQRGDAVLAVLEGKKTFGISIGNHWCGPGLDGLVFRPINEALVAFSV